MSDSHSVDVGDHIVIGGPLELEQAPTAYSINRRRLFSEAELDWQAIFGEEGKDDYDPRLLRSYFEDKWGVQGTEDLEARKQLFFSVENVPPPPKARSIFPVPATWPKYAFDPAYD